MNFLFSKLVKRAAVLNILNQYKCNKNYLSFTRSPTIFSNNRHLWLLQLKKQDFFRLERFSRNKKILTLTKLTQLVKRIVFLNAYTFILRFKFAIRYK